MTNRKFKPDDSVGYRHELIGPEDCRYMERWCLGFGPGMFRRSGPETTKKVGEDASAWFSVRLHHFFRSDEDHLHDHPTGFLTIVLRGSYEDWIECPACGGRGLFSGESGYAWGCRNCGGASERRGLGQVLGTRMTPGTIRFRRPLHKHRVVTDGCWTLVLFGPKRRDWGFYVPEGWLRQRSYFKKYGGSAACQEGIE